MTEPILSIRDLRVSFATLDGTVEAVRGIDLHVNAGETVAIVGESGSGKSQTMMAVMQLLASNGTATGHADYRGRNLLALGKAAMNEVRGKKISMIFQEPMTSWGVLIAAGAKNIGSANWLLIFPAVFLVSTLFALNFVGDGLRDALDPKDR